jgi:hypothetical protein
VRAPVLPSQEAQACVSRLAVYVSNACGDISVVLILQSTVVAVCTTCSTNEMTHRACWLKALPPPTCNWGCPVQISVEKQAIVTEVMRGFPHSSHEMPG